MPHLPARSTLTAVATLRGAEHRATRPLVVGTTLDLLANWMMLIALLSLTYAVTGDVRLVALVMLARVLPRALATLTGGPWFPATTVGTMTGLALLRSAAIASLVLIDQRADLIWAVPVVALISGLGLILETRRCEMLGDVVPRVRLVVVNAVCATLARVAFVAGAATSGVLLLWWSPRAVIVVGAAIVLADAGAVLLAARRAGLEPRRAVALSPEWSGATGDGLSVVQRLRRVPRLQLTVGSLFVNGLIAASMQIALVVLILDTFDRSFAMLGLAFACVALGTLLGPLPIPRLLVRLSPALLLAGGAGAIVVALAVAVYAPWSGVVLAVAFASGLLGVTNEAVASLAIRRAVPVVQLDDALRVMRRGVSAGQLCALIGAVLIAELWVGDVTIVAITVACLTLFGVLFLHDGGGDLVSRTTRRTGQRA